MNVKRICQTCNKEFEIGSWDIKLGRGKFCSVGCKRKGQRTGKYIKCDACGKKYWVTKSRLDLYNEHFCSTECRGIGEKNRSRTIKICKACGKEYEVVNSQAPYSKTCSRECDGMRKRLLYKGAGSPSWKGGLTDINLRIRGTAEYSDWRNAVFARDWYSCRCCGRKSDADIVAHHLNGFSHYPEQRTDIDNGITLCKKCHYKFHGEYGNGCNTKEQYQEFFSVNLESILWA